MKVLSGHTTEVFESTVTISDNPLDDLNGDHDVFVQPPDVGHSSPDLSKDGEAGLFDPLHNEMIHAGDPLRKLTGVGTLNLLEMCAPWDAPLTQTVREYGGKAMSIGVHKGYDLPTLKGFRAAAHLIPTCRSKYLHVSTPCDPWAAIQTCNQGNPEQVHRLQERSQVNKKLPRNLRSLVEIQVLELNRQGPEVVSSPTPCRWGTSASCPELGNSRYEGYGHGSVVRWPFFCSWLPTWFIQ